MKAYKESDIFYLILNVKSYLRMEKYKELESYINDFQSKTKSFSLSELISDIEEENRYLQNEMLSAQQVRNTDILPHKEKHKKHEFLTSL